MNILSDKAVKIRKNAADVKNISNLINMCLPKQGAIEVQNDAYGKEHAWHQHDTNETIILLEGSLKFYWHENEVECKAGDVIELPKGVKHGSIALENGAKYIITFEKVSI
jgi:quercetin dioxygenase-like cupin family protein